MEKSRLGKARAAYDKKSIAETKQAHTEKTILENIEHHDLGQGKYLGDVVYGALDGIVTTFAVVSGVEGASLPVGVIIIMGFANLLGDGTSMALGNYLSTKSEMEFIRRERSREEWEVENYPRGEKEEVRAIYSKKGFKGKDLDRAVGVITSNKKVWVDTMMNEELGLVNEHKEPIKGAMATFMAFVIAGFLPVLGFVLALLIPSFVPYSFTISIVLTFVALFAAGALRVYVTHKTWWKSGLEMLVIGSIAAALAYLVGFFLRGLA